MSFSRSKTIFVALLGLLIIGAGFFVAFGGSRIEYGEADESLEVYKRAGQLAAGQASRTDTDKDGLYDWEETLWSTDPKKPDTDGDGDTDGKEVDDDRNPAMAGPNDSLIDETTGEIAFPGEEGSSDLTDTDRAGREFFARYLELRENGGLEDPNSQQELFQTILGSISQGTGYRPLVTSDILVGQQTGAESIKIYANSLGLAFLKPLTKTENETSILLRSLQNENERELEKLDPIIRAHKDLYETLKTIVAPKGAEKIHLDLLNALGLLGQTVQDMRQAYSDPVVMFAGVTRYQSEVDIFFTALANLQRYLRDNAVVFDDSDPGKALMFLTSGQ